MTTCNDERKKHLKRMKTEQFRLFTNSFFFFFRNVEGLLCLGHAGGGKSGKFPRNRVPGADYYFFF